MSSLFGGGAAKQQAASQQAYYDAQVKQNYEIQYNRGYEAAMADYEKGSSEATGSEEAEQTEAEKIANNRSTEASAEDQAAVDESNATRGATGTSGNKKVEEEEEVLTAAKALTGN